MRELEILVPLNSEVVTILLLVGSHLLITPFVLSNRLAVAFPALILLGCAAAYLMLVRGIDPMVYGHYIPGVTVLVASNSILAGNGGPLITKSVIGPLLILINEGFISQHGAWKVQTRHFYSLSHHFEHFIGAVWAVSLVADHYYQRFRSPKQLRALRLARAAHDPAAMAALGIFIWAHQHDLTGIGEFFHDSWGKCFIAMALLHVVSSMVHAVLPRHAPLSVLVRAVHAYSWMVSGVWACLMAFWFNVWGSSRFTHQTQGGERVSGVWTGMREIIYPLLKQEMPTAYEEGMHLLGFTLWFTAALLARRLYVSSDILCTESEDGEASVNGHTQKRGEHTLLQREEDPPVKETV